MDLRRLRSFVAVAESGSISKAAQKIFLTQPALSRQIKALEDEVGQLLLERQAHSVKLTSAGEVLLEEGRALLLHAGKVMERVRAAGREGIRLRIGYAPTLASGLLSAALASFTQKHPAAQVELLDLSSKEMLSGLEAGTLDVALTVAPDKEVRGLCWTPLLELPWRLAISREHPLARRARISPQEAAQEPLLVFCQREYPEYWLVVTAWLRAQGLHQAIAGEYDGVTSLLAAVESGLGVALVPSSSADFVPRRACLRTLSSQPKPTAIALGYRGGRDSEKPLAVFIEELRQAAASPSQAGA